MTAALKGKVAWDVQNGLHGLLLRDTKSINIDLNSSLQMVGCPHLYTWSHGQVCQLEERHLGEAFGVVSNHQVGQDPQSRSLDFGRVLHWNYQYSGTIKSKSIDSYWPYKVQAALGWANLTNIRKCTSIFWSIFTLAIILATYEWEYFNWKCFCDQIIIILLPSSSVRHEWDPPKLGWNPDRWRWAPKGCWGRRGKIIYFDQLSGKQLGSISSDFLKKEHFLLCFGLLYFWPFKAGSF